MGAVRRVVIVDDDGDIRLMLRLMIGSEEDLEIVGEAADGREGVEVVLEQNPDLVVMDLMMGGLNGIDATRAIKKAAPEVQVIGFTSARDDVSAHEMEGAGIAVRVQKTETKGLLPVIRRVLDLRD